MKIQVRRIDKSLQLSAPNPVVGAAGADLACRVRTIIEPRSVALVPVNIAVGIPEGYFMLLAARSSMPLEKGLMLANGIGIIDPYARGDKAELKIQLFNYGDKQVIVEAGECLTQVILLKGDPIEWEEIDSFGEAESV